MSEPLPDELTQTLPTVTPPPPRRRRRGLLIGAAVALAVVLLAGTGWAILYHPAAPARTAGPAASTKPAKGTGHRMRGTILTESGSTWTVRATNGRTVTVTVTGQTAFGTAKHPLTSTDFPVGSTVAVTATVDHGTVTATRIAAVAAAKPSASPSA